jgi:hypothetical protein
MRTVVHERGLEMADVPPQGAGSLAKLASFCRETIDNKMVA